MKKTPYIKWYQNTKEIFIEILDYCEDNIIKFDNKLYYEDSKYKIELDLLNTCTLENKLYSPNILTLKFKKEEIIQWSQLLKNKKDYSYFISINWDKLVKEDLFLNNNVDFDSEEFDYLLKSGALDNMSDTDSIKSGCSVTDYDTDTHSDTCSHSDTDTHSDKHSDSSYKDSSDTENESEENKRLVEMVKRNLEYNEETKQEKINNIKII